MKMVKIIAGLLLGGLLLGLLPACRSKEGIPLPQAPSTPLEAPEEIPYDDVDYEALMKNTFEGAKEATLEELSYTLSDGKITLHAYRGNATAVRLPENVVAIDSGAFENQSKLEILILPDGVKEIGEGILQGCTSLRALRTPLLSKNVSTQGYLGYLFGATSYRDNAKDVPASLEMLWIGGSMTSLDAFALYDCNDLLCVGFPATLKELGSHALYGCLALKYLPTEQLEVLGDHALAACPSFVSLNFGTSLREIGFGAFEGCIALRDMTLPFAGASLGKNDFMGYVFGAEVPDFAKGYYPSGLQRITLLSTCTSLGNYAFFECESLREIILPQELKAIGVRAFADCDGLTSLDLPRGLETIRENAFTGCDYLESVTLGESLTSIGVNAFYNCLSLREISLPSTLGTLSASCFANCVSLQSVTLGGVTRVEKNAFRNCIALTAVSSSQSVKWEKGNDRAKELLG